MRIAECGLRNVSSAEFGLRIAEWVVRRIGNGTELTMSDYAGQLKDRTKQYALRIIRLVNSLPPTAAARTIGDQLLRSGTSVASNYRAACRARSRAEFCSKLGIVEEESDESVFWMELIVESGMLKAAKVAELMKEGHEITAVIVTSINTARRNQKNPPQN